MNLSFFLSLAVRRMRSSACVTLVRLGVRVVLCWSAFPLVAALRSTSSFRRSLCLVRRLRRYCGHVRLPASVRHRLRLLAFPMRTEGACRLRSNAGPPRFRRGPLLRDGVFDHGRASAPRITGPHMLPSTLLTASASASFCLSRLNSHPTASLCTLRCRRRRRHRNTHYRAPATAYPDRTSTGWTAPACLAHKQSRAFPPSDSGSLRCDRNDAKSAPC
ncbi:hypothetical protein ACVWXO_004797 [Bradyrhizobium sp. LM2.7]